MASALLGFLIPILKDIQNTRYSELASTTIIVYDHLITFDEEVQQIWRASWTIGKVLFLLNRYYTLFVVIFNNYALFSPNTTDDNSCLHWFKWQGWTGLVACALAEIILQLRLYALYYGNKKVLVLMVGAFIAAMATSATIMETVLNGIIARAHFVPTTTFCIAVNVSPHFYAFWIPILSFETLLCSLALFRGYRSYKDQELKLELRRRKARRRANGSLGNLASVKLDAERNTGLSILEILLRDSVIFFIIMFATYFTTTMIWIMGPFTVIEIPIGFTVAMSCVIGNRLLLNLRGSHRRTPSAANAGYPQATFSQNVMSAIGTGHMQLTSTGTTTIEYERGRERKCVGEFELQALRGLRHQRSV